MYQKMFQRKIFRLIIDRRRRKKHVLIKDFNRFTYDHSLHCGKKHFCRYRLQAFITLEILKRHIKDCFKMMVNKRL